MPILESREQWCIEAHLALGTGGLIGARSGCPEPPGCPEPLLPFSRQRGVSMSSLFESRLLTVTISTTSTLTKQPSGKRRKEKENFYITRGEGTKRESFGYMCTTMLALPQPSREVTSTEVLKSQKAHSIKIIGEKRRIALEAGKKMSKRANAEKAKPRHTPKVQKRKFLGVENAVYLKVEVCGVLKAENVHQRLREEVTPGLPRMGSPGPRP